MTKPTRVWLGVAIILTLYLLYLLGKVAGPQPWWLDIGPWNEPSTAFQWIWWFCLIAWVRWIWKYVKDSSNDE